MKNLKMQLRTIDEYIGKYPADIQDRLQQIRQVIHQAVPDAEETISYQMPTFKLNGILVSFGAFKGHIGLYPAPSGIAEFEQALAPYIAGKGTLQFTNDAPIPFDLITRVVQFRAKENLDKLQNKRSKKSIEHISP